MSIVDRLTEIITATNSEKVKQVLNVYDPASTSDEIRDRMVNESKGVDLSETITHLKTFKDKYPILTQQVGPNYQNKNKMASDIYEFLERLKSADCRVCKKEYLPVEAENVNNNDTACQLCNRHCHKECYSDREINPEIGVFYLCTLCSINLKQLKEIPRPETEKPEDEEQNEDHQPTGHNDQQQPLQPDAHNENNGQPPPPGTRQDTTALQDNQMQRQPSPPPHEDENREICPLLLEAGCPFGLRGTGCNFYHPRSCFYYTKYGEDPFDGCRRRKRCRYLHPKLCSNSVNLKICLNAECKQVHVRGTQRRQSTHHDIHPKPKPQNTFAPWNNSQSNMQSVSQENNTQHSDSRQTERRENELQRQNEERNSLTNMQFFLEKCLEKMKADLSSHIENKIDNRISSFLQQQPQPQMPQTQISQTQPQPPQTQSLPWGPAQQSTHSPPVQMPTSAQQTSKVHGQQLMTPLTFMNYPVMMPQKI